MARFLTRQKTIYAVRHKDGTAETRMTARKPEASQIREKRGRLRKDIDEIQAGCTTVKQGQIVLIDNTYIQQQAT